MLESQQRLLQTTQQQLQAATDRVAVLEKKLAGLSPTAKLDEPFSLRSEEQRQQARGRKPKPKNHGRRGRRRTKDKIGQAEPPKAFTPKVSRRSSASCRTSARCGGWKTAGPC